MWGQWLGRINGETNAGHLTLNIDRDKPYSGRILVLDDEPKNLSFAADLAMTQRNEQLSGTLSNFIPLDPEWGTKTGSGAALPRSGELSGTVRDAQIQGNWDTDIGTKGEFLLQSYETDAPSLPTHQMDWEEFKRWALGYKMRDPGVIFRGHSNNSYRLQTTFHRSGRRDLLRYASQDVHVLGHWITAVLGHRFNLADPYEHGGLLNLAQHHGYPTPLLDWTESPFVAAYFAYARLPKQMPNSDKFVRIYAFSKRHWELILPPRNEITAPGPAFSVHALSAQGNNRAFPQQSVVTFSNVVEMEHFIDHMEEATSTRCLLKVDLPESQRDAVMRELEYMGITAASLFPGLDGVCKGLRERFF